MSQEGTTERDPLQRPLPSVEAPLLRENRRAIRLRRGVLLTLCSASCATGIILWVATHSLGLREISKSPRPADSVHQSSVTSDAGANTLSEITALQTAESRDSEPAEPNGLHAVMEAQNEVAAEPSEVEPARLPETSHRVALKFGKANGFRPALQRAGLSRAECQEIEDAVRDALDFRRCRPEHEIVIERGDNGTVKKFEYHDNTTSFVQVHRNRAGRLETRRIDRPIERVALARGGVIMTSLGDGLRRIGLRRSLVSRFIEAFENRIDFSTDTREGDTFRILLTEERLEQEFLRYGQIEAIEYSGSRTGVLHVYWYAPLSNSPDFYDESGRGVHGGWLRSPCRYQRVSSLFDPQRMHPILRRVVPHNGIDFAADTGTPVWAAAKGVVTWAGPKGPNGKLVAIRHEGGYESFYAHLHRIHVERGDRVEQRQQIGQVGSTGRSTGPHLHFGLKLNGTFIDPLTELNGPGQTMPSAALPRYRRHVRRVMTRLKRIEVPVAER
ncbi:MAG: M23 family metallopeptidase [Myxococcota bacterium]